MGYTIHKTKSEVDLYTACDVLRSRKQKYITSVERVDNKAIIYRHRIRCPHCGKEIPAYSHCWNKRSSAFRKKSVAEITEWANIQPSLINEPDEEMKIQEYEDFSGEYICPKCGYSSYKSSEYAELYINYIGAKLYVKRAIKNLSEIVSLKWLNGATSIVFPIYEQVVFDFESRNTYMEFLSDETVICTTPLTDFETDFSGDMLFDLLSKNNLLKRTVRRCFEEITGFKMPFTTSELDIDKFANFVRFVGFPKDFYEAIPFWGGTRVVDESFKEITDNLHNPESAMKLLEKTTLPFCKSVKRLFAKRSGLFFYLRECEFLYNLFDDVNLFCTYLNKKFIFDFLSMMHYYDYSLKTFLTDFSAVLGKKRFADRFSISQDLISYAMSYSSLSLYIRKKEQKKWSKTDVFEKCYFRLYIANEISVPLPFVSQSMKDCVIDNYRFKYLRTKQDCVITGEKMRNCLVDWYSYSNPVIVIYRGDKIVAAVEFLNNVLEQARMCQNRAIDPNSDLYNVIVKWCEMNNIEFNSEKLDDLPF